MCRIDSQLQTAFSNSRRFAANCHQHLPKWRTPYLTGTPQPSCLKCGVSGKVPTSAQPAVPHASSCLSPPFVSITRCPVHQDRHTENFNANSAFSSNIKLQSTSAPGRKSFCGLLVRQLAGNPNVKLHERRLRPLRRYR